MLAIDTTMMPLSRYGSYLALSQLSARGELPAGLWVRNIHGDAAPEVFLLEPLVDGAPVAYTASATPGEVILTTPRGRVRVCLAGVELLRVRGEGVGFRLTVRPGSHGQAIPQAEGRWLLNVFPAFRNYLLYPLAGTLTVDAPWQRSNTLHAVVDVTPDPASGVCEAALEQGLGSWPVHAVTGGYEAAVEAVLQEFDAFAAPYRTVPAAWRETTELAAFLNWSSVVAPCGHFARPAMLMSKNWMTNVWAWDHAFNALALAPHQPQLAWDQLLILFDHQQATGQIPDFINDVNRLYNFVKPPVHGWIYRRLMDAHPYFRERDRIAEVYPKLAAWTEWWFTYRNPDGDGLPQYHHGNDSGWDNGTVFDAGVPLKGADLAAFLAVQMDVLAELAGRLGDEDAQRAWRARAEAQIARLVSTLWRDGGFVSINALTGAATPESDSVFSCLPMLLGLRLPEAVRAGLVTRIGHYLTAWGLATEHPDSPLYEADGYWRGPIWAPPTLIIVDGLRAAGETALAREITERFCALCARGGFAENFDAVTGAPLRDPAYTWTSSVFLVLARWLGEG